MAPVAKPMDQYEGQSDAGVGGRMLHVIHADHRPTALRSSGFVAVGVTGLAYYGGARIGLLPALVGGQISPFWPPTGIAVACLMLFGLRVWPGVMLAAVAANAPLGPTSIAVVVIAAGDTLAPVAAVLLLRAVGFSPRLSRLRDGLALVAVGAVAMMISATIGTGVLRLAGHLGARHYWSSWAVWWSGDAMGVIVIAPLLFLLPRIGELRQVRWPRWVEFGAFLAVVETLAYWVITAGTPAIVLLCPLLLWAAWRFGQVGTALAVLAMSVTACVSVASGAGPFMRSDLLASMLTLQAFNGAVALSGLVFGAAIAQLNLARRELRDANGMLARRVEERGAQLALDRSRLDVLADRHRIATQLHDTVLQRLFGAGTTLDRVARMDQPSKHRLNEVIDDLDACVNDLAAAIYQIDQDAFESSYADAVQHVLTAAGHTHGIDPVLTVIGDCERVPIAMRQQLLASLHEALTDLGGYPDPGDVAVRLSVSECEVALSVRTTSLPIRTHGSQDGIRMATARAQRLGGQCEWHVEAEGSVVSWRFPTGRRAAG